MTIEPMKPELQKEEREAEPGGALGPAATKPLLEVLSGLHGRSYFAFFFALPSFSFSDPFNFGKLSFNVGALGSEGSLGDFR